MTTDNMNFLKIYDKIKKWNSLEIFGLIVDILVLIVTFRIGQAAQSLSVEEVRFNKQVEVHSKYTEPLAYYYPTDMMIYERDDQQLVFLKIYMISGYIKRLVIIDFDGEEIKRVDTFPTLIGKFPDDTEIDPSLLYHGIDYPVQSSMQSGSFFVYIEGIDGSNYLDMMLIEKENDGYKIVPSYNIDRIRENCINNIDRNAIYQNYNTLYKKLFEMGIMK